MEQDTRVKTFIRKHPTEVVIGVAVVGAFVGWKLNGRSVAKAAEKLTKNVVDIQAAPAIVEKLLNEGGKLVFDLPKPRKAAQIVLYLGQDAIE